MDDREIYDTAKALAKDAKGVAGTVAGTASSAESLQAAIDALKPKIEQAGTGVATLGLAAKAVADAVAKAVEISAEVTAAIQAVGELHGTIAGEAETLGGKIAEISAATAGGVEPAQKVAARSILVRDALKPETVPGAWGRGPKSGLPWYSGARCSNDATVAKFVDTVRPGKPIDMIQCFTGPEQAKTWEDCAGGATDAPDEFDGLVSLKRGQQGAKFIWQTHPDLDAVLTTRPIPEAASNRNGQRPQSWKAYADGDLSWVSKRLGRKFAGLDAKYPRTGRTIIEIAHEFTGSWYAHSIDNAHQYFAEAWRQIVTAIRAGYREVAGRDCPYLFCLRPAREPVANDVWTEAWLPDPDFWDIIGLSQHDNQWAPCTPDEPRLNWRRYRKAEGLDNIAEIADRNDRLVGIYEWSSHNPGGEFDSGPNPDIFTRSMFDWFSRPDIRAMSAGECYFLSSGSTPVGWPNWKGTTELKATWGA